uniref:Histidine--tRNA ligase, chloroplastic n=1 Tax=Gracilaria tenuistipitata var. liui TaxID=285951 RepID=SYH_GRATL|nr:histidine-tRNA synthetase [Gracilaria tenuistipitata var. liui]Q6B910.1 RecName: Full=Histidine--tRNA ligase, chloroplastic; AltName: Full=Histidyl-tRNA synthetase; Short=HisRS [Gracilaria tenuistipitata var. liui]AAT79625.1 histidine tRNA synthetase [Gracilaria tenuistipitata var. liui]
MKSYFMQPLRGTKDILPNEINYWHHIHDKALTILSLHNYSEIRTPIIESTSLFKRSIGETSDIINKEMYTFTDQGDRSITLRPEATASIARAFISNKLYHSNIQRLWYLGPMFRYERPQSGRQRQFHQLGIECIGSINPMADTEVIHLANQLLKELQVKNYILEINSIGTLEERQSYKLDLVEYLSQYQQDLDQDSKNRMYSNPLRILDSKNLKTQEILDGAPKLKKYLNKRSTEHFYLVCTYLNNLNITYKINYKLVRGLDYYNQTAFEIKTNSKNSQNTICGGGRYDTLIEQLGGPKTPAVGWAIGIERLLKIIEDKLILPKQKINVYIATQGLAAQKKIWEIIQALEKKNIKFELDLSNTSFHKQIKKAGKLGAKFCIILGDQEIMDNCVTIKRLDEYVQYTAQYSNFLQEIHKLQH